MPSSEDETFKNNSFHDSNNVHKRYLPLLRDKFLWFLFVLAVIFTSLVYASFIITSTGWNIDINSINIFTVYFYRTIFIITIILATWRYGLTTGLISCFALSFVVFSSYILGFQTETSVFLDIGIVVISVVFIALINKYKRIQMLLEENTKKLQGQTIELSQEIIKRKQAEDKIKNVAEEWRTTFDSISSMISIHDKNYRIVRVNKAFANNFKMKPQDLIDKHCYEVCHQTEEPLKNCPHRITMDTHKNANIEIYLPDKEKYFQISTSPMFDKNGEFTGSVHITRDVTERKQMEQQLIMSDRLASIGELVSGVAHELNNPLTSIIGYSQLIIENNPTSDIKSDLDVIHGEAQRAAEIVKNLLTFARKHTPVKQLGKINNVIDGVLKLRAYEQKVNNINVNTDYATDLPEIMIDHFQMQQVFLNIIINAEYAMLSAHKKGGLKITTQHVDNRIIIKFIDDGPGIAKKDMPRIFSPFFTTKEVGKGTGLGLSICHGIMTEHNGKIYAESEPGKGSTFILELPINTEQSLKYSAQLN